MKILWIIWWLWIRICFIFIDIIGPLDFRSNHHFRWFQWIIAQPMFPYDAHKIIVQRLCLINAVQIGFETAAIEKYNSEGERSEVLRKVNYKTNVSDLLVEPPSASIRDCAWAAFTVSIDSGAIILLIECTEILSIVVCHRIQWFVAAAETADIQIVFVHLGVDAEYVIIEF